MFINYKQPFQYLGIFTNKLVQTCEVLLLDVVSFAKKGFAVKGNNDSRNNLIISLTDCKRILNRNGNNYSDDDILRIRDFLIVLAELQHSHFKSKQNETSNLIHPGFNR
jgi:hypothetical protein